MADNIKLTAQTIDSPTSGTRGVSDTASLEDYFKVQYPEVWKEQFYETDGIYKYAKKVSIRTRSIPLGFKLTKSSQQSYTLGDTWNLGSNFDGKGDTAYNENYEIPVGGNTRIGDRITGQVTTKRFISIMHLSEDFIYKAQNSDIDLDFLNEMFDDHEKLQIHRQKSQVYLSKNGNLSNIVGGRVGSTYQKTGATATDFTVTLPTGPAHAEIFAGKGYPRSDVADPTTAYPVLALQVENDAYFIEGEKVLLRGATAGDVTDGTNNVVVTLKVWQKDYTDLDNPVILFQVISDEIYGDATGAKVVAAGNIEIKEGAHLARLQLAVGGTLPLYGGRVGIKQEYEGLKDILFTQNNVICGINRQVYPIFNCSITDLGNKILTAEALTKHLNAMRRRSSDLVNTKVIAASPEALSAVEASFMQLYKYTHDPISGNTVNVGINEVKFYDHTLLKDDFAEHGKGYIVKPGVWAEAEYRPWSWITGGADGMLGFMDRIPQTGLYEGWMSRDANGYTEEFNTHSGFINLSEVINVARFSGLDNA